MVVVKGHELIKVAVTGGQRPDLSVVIGPETLRSLLVDFISRCWHQTPDDRPTFAGICLSVEIFYYTLNYSLQFVYI